VCGLERGPGASPSFSLYIYIYINIYLFSFFIAEVPRILNPSTPNASSIASSIKYHAEFTPLFSPERFELPKAYYATAQSVRDALIINWNSTYESYERLNAKQAYYLSMEFLQVCCVPLRHFQHSIVLLLLLLLLLARKQTSIMPGIIV
jgi:hypothetical protein